MAVARQALATPGRIVATLAFLPPVFLLLTSTDVMLVAAASRQVAPEVFAAITVLVVLAVIARRGLVTLLNVGLAIAGGAPVRLTGVGAAVAVGGPLGLILAGSLDLVALLALIGAALPELIAMAALVAILTLMGRTVYRFALRVGRSLRGRLHQ